MDHLKKFIVVQEALAANDIAKASEILHNILVEKSRAIYEEASENEFEDEVGSDEDFASEIEQSQEEIDNEETGEEELEAEDEFSAEEESEESDEVSNDERLLDLEQSIAELTAKFDALYSEELSEPNHEDLPGTMDSIEDQYSDEIEVEEGMYEATEFLKKVSVDAKTEDRLSGTGKNSSISKTTKDSMFTKAPQKTVVGKGKAVLTKGSVTEPKKVSVSDETPTDNTKIQPKAAPKADTKGHDDKSTKSTLTKVAK